jgi:hypothetical protein
MAKRANQSSSQKRYTGWRYVGDQA